MALSIPIYGKCKKYTCGCQRFRPKNYATNECFFCNHVIGFHELSPIDTLEFPYGSCNEPECGCQRFKSQPLDNLRCTYCDHFEGFHSNWETPISNVNPITLLNNFQSNIIPNSNITSNTSSQFTNPRAEVIANFRPTQVIPLYSSQLRNARAATRRRTGNFPTHNAGRPQAPALTINFLICFEKLLPNRLPKEGTAFWFHLQAKSLIKENIEISQTDELYNIIHNLFNEKLNDQGWILYSGSSGSPQKVIHSELSFNLIKSNITKAKKKLYIGPDTHDIDPDNVFSNSTVNPSQNLTVDPSQNLTVDSSQNLTVDHSQNLTVDSSQNLTVTPSQNLTADSSIVDPSQNPSQNPINPTSDSTNLNNWLTEPIDNILDLEFIEDTDNSSLTIIDDIQEFKNAIREYLNELKSLYPNTTSKTIIINSTTHENCFKDFCEQIKNFNDLDFVYRPFIRIQQEEAIDAGGVLFDVLSKIFKIFLTYKNSLFGGEGFLFIGDYTKTVSETVFVDFVEELQIFGDILFLTIIYEGPFPLELNPSVLKYCMGFEEQIGIEDLSLIYPQLAEVVRKISSSEINCNLSDIENFDSIAIEFNIQKSQYSLFTSSKANLQKLASKICKDILITKRIEQLSILRSRFNKFDFINYLKTKKLNVNNFIQLFYEEICEANQVIQKLKFGLNLNDKQSQIKLWLVEWLENQDSSRLSKFCYYITGFCHPRNSIQIRFKNTDIQNKNLIFHVCTSELELSEEADNKEEFNEIMDAVFAADLDGFSILPFRSFRHGLCGNSKKNLGRWVFKGLFGIISKSQAGFFYEILKTPQAFISKVGADFGRFLDRTFTRFRGFGRDFKASGMAIRSNYYC
ncbi:unnamed protein product [Rhizophagus irregularis]|nr:unnamed protein product [Rhizophagus irregularis]CAB4435848.1 unnamed protein product [Rhizophagus irregularis]CAB4444634.1 unnamed protein product [Rhizophagus irregularis]